MKKFVKSCLGKIRHYNGVKTPVILQLSETECGIACLAIIFSFYQLNLPLEELREMCGTSRDGSKLITLIKAARQYGFLAEAFKMDIDAIKILQEPVIAFWRFNHFVVIDGVGHNKVFINDPAQGRISVSLEDFDKYFTGIILSIRPTPNAAKQVSPPVLKIILKEWLADFKSELTFLLITLFLILSSPLLNSVLNNIFIDQGIISSRIDWIPYISGFSVAVSLILGFSTFLQKWNQFKLCVHASLLKTAQIIQHTLKLPLLFFALRQKSEIIALLSRAEGAVHLFFKNAVNLGVGLTTIFICLIVMVKIDKSLAFLSLWVALLPAFSIYFVSRIKLSYEKSNMEAIGKIYGISMSTIRNIETIKACALENQALKKWHAFFIRKMKIQDKIQIANVVMETLSKFYEWTSTLLILSLGGFQIAKGKMSVGSLMAYYAIHLFFCKTIHLIFNAFKESQSAYVTHIRIHDVMKYEKEKRFHNLSTSTACDQEKILSCKQLTFFYNKNEAPALSNINANIYKGQHIGLVGSTGSGKSTLAKLMGGLYQPHGGEIILGDRLLSNFSAPELASHFSYVSQEVCLFTGTLYDNLTLWKKDIPFLIIEEAIHDACLSDLVDERGLYAKVSEAGNNFSGGERQRIEIARSLIQNTPLLILDEATASLDVKTETRLIQNLRNKKNKTILFIAHRLSTIKHCDQIWTMQNGQIIERGTHEALMAIQNRYFQLVQADHQTADQKNNLIKAYEVSVY